MAEGTLKTPADKQKRPSFSVGGESSPTGLLSSAVLNSSTERERHQRPSVSSTLNAQRSSATATPNANAPLITSSRARRTSVMSTHSIGASALGAQSARNALKVNVNQVHVDGDDGGIEMRSASEFLAVALELRAKYKGCDKGQREISEKLPSIPKITVDYGVYHFAGQSTGEGTVPSWEDYYSDIMKVFAAVESGFCRSACKYRLAILEEKYNLYRILNTDSEESVDKQRRGGGVHAGGTKVDGSIRLNTGMTAMELLDTIQHAFKNHAYQEEPLFDWGDNNKSDIQNLRTLFAAAEIDDADSLTIEGLGLHPLAEAQATHRFDVLDPVRNRAGKQATDLLKAFLSRDTLDGGKLLQTAVRTPLMRIEGDDTAKNVSLLTAGPPTRTKSQAAEFSIEVHGRSQEEWYALANWVQELNDVATKVMWVIEIPRVKSNRGSFNFEFQQAQLDNIFRPLFEATLLPDDVKNHKLAALLSRVGAFSLRSDEDTRDVDFSARALPPGELPWSMNPSDLYFAYYLWANLCSLNACRSRQKPPHNNTFQFRSVAGERATQLDSLVYSFLLCDNISQGLLLKEHPVLQFLYGITGVGVFMSPLANNGAEIPYMDNPFPTFFRRSLNVSLATYHPLHYHHSDDPLTEEYSTAAKLYKLSPVDVTEIARNSAMFSSFPKKTKRKWLLGDYPQESQFLNAMECTNVPNCRLEFREACWSCERQVIDAARRRRTSSASTGMNFSRLPSPQQIRLLSPQHASLPDKERDSFLIDSPQSPTAPQGKWGRSGLHVVDQEVRYTRVVFDGPSDREATQISCAALLHRALKLRAEYHLNKTGQSDVAEVLGSRTATRGPGVSAFGQGSDRIFKESAYAYATVKGVICLHETTKFPRVPEHIRTYDEFRNHMEDMLEITQSGPLKSFAHRRLQLLEHKYRLHVAVNHSLEAGSTEEKASSNRDFYQATKVDTTVRTETGMTARNLLAFIQAKATNNGDDIVSQREGRAPQTLRQLLEELSINPTSLTVDDLDVQVDATRELSIFQFTPEAKDELLTLLLKTDNEMKGRYFAELTKYTFEQFKRDNFTFAEYRLPIYGASSDEWERLSSWFDTHGMACYNNRWMIQIPRIYSYLRKKDRVKNFADYLNNIFKPLWEVSLHPTKHRWGPRLFHFLNHLSGFDCVEDESKADTPLKMATKAPQEWTEDIEPPFSYYLYHVWANIQTLNDFRRSRGYSTFCFRPSCGEDGGLDHLMSGFLVADGISYGLTLRLDSVMQYLFYLGQTPISVSPLSNNTKMLDYLDNPFPRYFKRGLHVSLSTDGPLRYHHTQEPLIEEYSIASKVWKLSPNDMCEIARNSVQQSGFPSDFKAKVLGDHFFLSSHRGNDAAKTHLSDIRVTFRWEAYLTEMSLLEFLCGESFPKAMRTLEEEKSILGEIASKAQQGAPKAGIIVATHDEVDVQKLAQTCKLTQSQLSEVDQKVQELQRQNKQLSETLAEVMAKEVTARHHRTGTSPIHDEEFGETPETDYLLGYSSGSEETETDEESEEDDGGPSVVAATTVPELQPAQLVEAESGDGVPTSGPASSRTDHPEMQHSFTTGFHGQNPRTSYVAFAPTPHKEKDQRSPSLLEANESLWGRTSEDASRSESTIGVPSVANSTRRSEAQRLLSDTNDELSSYMERLATSLDQKAPKSKGTRLSGGGLVRMLASSEQQQTPTLAPAPRAPPRGSTSQPTAVLSRRKRSSGASSIVDPKPPSPK